MAFITLTFTAPDIKTPIKVSIEADDEAVIDWAEWLAQNDTLPGGITLDTDCAVSFLFDDGVTQLDAIALAKIYLGQPTADPLQLDETAA